MLPLPVALQAGSTACWTLLFPILRYALDVSCFRPLALAALQPVWTASAAKVPPERQECAIEKFTESLWKLAVYSVFLVLGVVAVWRQPFLHDTWQFWLGWPQHEFTLAQRLQYHGQLGFYISSVFMILFWEVRRKDFAVMFSHHIATVLLIAASLHFRFWRVGSLVMLLHDCNDVLMEAAKLAKYCRREDVATGLFVAFVLAWLGLRLGAFPCLVIRSTLSELPAVLGGDATLYWGFNGLLLLLLCLHCYWFTLILRVAWLTLTTGEAADVREDED